MTKDIGEQLNDHLAKVRASTVTPEDRALIIEATCVAFGEWNQERMKEIRARAWEAKNSAFNEGAEQIKLTAIITEWAKVKDVSMSEAFKAWGDDIAGDTRAHLKEEEALKQRQQARGLAQKPTVAQK